MRGGATDQIGTEPADAKFQEAWRRRIAAPLIRNGKADSQIVEALQSNRNAWFLCDTSEVATIERVKKKKHRLASGKDNVRNAMPSGKEDVVHSEVSLGPLGNFVGFRMRRVHDIQTREFLRLTREENLSQGMFTALALISANPGSSQVKLAQEMGLHTSAMVSLIDDLERRRWVVRQKSLSDRRRYQLVLSPEGEQALRRLINVLDEVESSSLVTLTATEVKVLMAALDKLYIAYRSRDVAEGG